MLERGIAAALAAGTVLLVAAPGASAAGRTIDYLAETCLSCHRPGAREGIPSLTGRPGGEVARALTDYKSGVRQHPIMNAIAAELDLDEIGMLAAYLAKQR